MDVKELQAAIGVTADGMFGPISRAALLDHFTNTNAPAANSADMLVFASNLGCTGKQLSAVASVESSGGGFDNHGRPKILYERHLFHRQTDGKWSPTIFSNKSGGGYGQSSWDKLAAACAKDPDAAFGACSWGKFQVLGLHWSKLGYESPYALAYSCVTGEAEHYDLFARYIQAFGLADELRAITDDPEDCRALARGYNGPNYEKFNYHKRIAKAMEQ